LARYHEYYNESTGSINEREYFGHWESGPAENIGYVELRISI
jgi:hypothetical protein